ncbi:type II pantothenate kinase [Oceanobacillus sp. CAU 1775]
MRIGIDAGGSLVKIAYEEKEKLQVRKYAIEEIPKLVEWLSLVAPDAELVGTGGNWPKIQEATKQKNSTVDEFTALVNGTKHLLQTEKKYIDTFILTSIGTGTSIFYVGDNTFERVLGSGIGGGTWMGLGAKLTNAQSFSELLELAGKGNRENNDLLVKDIYEGNENIPLLGDLTAANFGKAHKTDSMEADHAAALNQLIGEVILSLSGNVAQVKEAKNIVFIGATIQDNNPLQQVLTSFKDMLGFEPIFLELGAFAGAVGALFD